MALLSKQDFDSKVLTGADSSILGVVEVRVYNVALYMPHHVK